MAEKVPLADQCAAGQTELYNALSMGIVQPENIEACKQLMKTLEWIKDKGDAIKIAAKLADDDWLKSAKEAFPGAEVTGIE